MRRAATPTPHKPANGVARRRLIHAKGRLPLSASQLCLPSYTFVNVLGTRVYGVSYTLEQVASRTARSRSRERRGPRAMRLGRPRANIAHDARHFARRPSA